MLKRPEQTDGPYESQYMFYFWIQITAVVSKKNFKWFQKHSSLDKSLFSKMSQWPETLLLVAILCENAIFTYLQLVVFGGINLIPPKNL